MAIVQDKGNPSSTIDPPLTTPNRTNAGEPNGSLTPQFSGEIVLDTTNNALWIATNLTNTGWVTLTTPA